MSKEQRLTVDEAIRIGNKTTGFVSSYDFCSGMAEAYINRPSNEQWFDWLVFVMFCSYNAGRIYGIRQERQKRKENLS